MQFDRAMRIHNTAASELRSSRYRDHPLMRKIKDMYEDAKGILKTLSCGRTDDILPHASNMPELRSARPSEAVDTRAASGRRDVCHFKC